MPRFERRQELDQRVAEERGNMNYAAMLLKEALEWVEDEPWEDQTGLHDRISDFLGLPRAYLDCDRSIYYVFPEGGAE